MKFYQKEKEEIDYNEVSDFFLKDINYYQLYNI